MEKKNVYVRAREVVRELVPVLQAIRQYDKSLADQLSRPERDTASMPKRAT